jgi:hypothetical protein
MPRAPMKNAPILLFFLAQAQAADVTHLTIHLPRNPTALEQKIAQVLIEESEKRSNATWQISQIPTIAPEAPSITLTRTKGPPEGFTLTSAGTHITIAGNNDRGTLYGAGQLLRSLHYTRTTIELPQDLNLTTAPKTKIRGHQLGYRPKTNSYDGWTIALWDQYIRDLALFGTNTIELIPPRSDDAPDSPHFPLPPLRMMQEMSRIAASYGLDVSVWYPALDSNYADPATVAYALAEWEQIFRALPRIDAIFTPGGDPGHTQPQYLLALLEKQSQSLHRYHPNATMWVSPQSFDRSWMEEFYTLLAREPKWLTGVVYGPQVRDSLETVRRRTPARYPVRFYPDITHSLRAQFPVPGWDVAFARTEGREGINPRPLDQAAIFRASRASTIGFVTYSEGCNDDVNKFLWSALAWNPEAQPLSILRDYSNFFIGTAHAESFAQGLLALEQNWRGPLLANTSVPATLARFQQLEQEATPQEKLNWRWQQAQYRANYDAYIQARLKAETTAEQHVLAALRAAGPLEAALSASLNAAEAELDRAYLHRIEAAPALHARIFELAEALFQSIRMQLSVPRYAAIAVDRGANLDTVDLPLNNYIWLKQQFAAIRALPTESERATAVNRILNWTDPGPGGFYDDLGNSAAQPHLTHGQTGFGNTGRLSSVTHAETLWEDALEMRYQGLNPTARYKLRVIYAGDTPRAKIRLVANQNTEIHPLLRKLPDAEPREFLIPPSATAGGELQLQWSGAPGLGGNGRGVQVAEVWLFPLI